MGAIPTRWRKRPVEITAMGPLTVNNVDAIRNWCNAYASGVRPDGKPYITISTLEGDMEAQEGDWIIRGVQGEHYPCKPDIFATTYEPVEDSNV